MNKSIDSDSIYRSVVDVLTTNYTVNLFSSSQRENLAKKISHKISTLVGEGVDKSNSVATHMGDEIINRENKTDDLLTQKRAQEIKKEEEKKKNSKSKKNDKIKSQSDKKTSGLKNLKK